MKSTFDFNQFFEKAKTGDAYWIEQAKLEFTEELCAQLGNSGMNRKDLAAKLGKSPAAITKMLRGDNNFELATMVKLARALDSELRVHLQPEGVKSQWYDLVPHNHDHPAGIACEIQKDASADKSVKYQENYNAKFSLIA
jgi:transcriptional regulator with XRE-family HTH domain